MTTRVIACWECGSPEGRHFKDCPVRPRGAQVFTKFQRDSIAVVEPEKVQFILSGVQAGHDTNQRTVQTMDTATFERLESERAELAERIAKLDAFIFSDAYRELPIDEKADLLVQLSFMRAYHEVLARRIERNRPQG